MWICFLQVSQIVDPVADSTYKDTWMATAKVRKPKKINVYFFSLRTNSFF